MLRLILLSWAALLVLSATVVAGPTVTLDRPMSPPQWALLERLLLETNTRACGEYLQRYFDPRGYLECVERWGGNDGPDDAIENLTDWPLLYALGGDEVVAQWIDRAWEGHLRQYTAARTTQVDFARDGMYYREFPVMMDWVHNGEGLTVFNLQGLIEPRALKFRQRVERFAGFYLPGDPQAANYDPQHRIIRSLFNGSRGPLLRKATAVDWAGDPIEIEHRFKPGHGERNYQEMLDHFKDYTDVIGDHPQNLLATTLPLNAFALTHDEKYRRWALEYADAWLERAASNGDIFPSNVGLDGRIGSAVGGKWYGGVYGWGFTVIDPVTGKQSHRNTVRLAVMGLGNALLLSGEQKYVDAWRRQLDALERQGRVIEGRKQYPYMHGDQGWYDFHPQPYPHGAFEIWYWSQREADHARVAEQPWLKYLSGQDSLYPEHVLQRDLQRIRTRVDGLRQDRSTPDTRLADDMAKFNPCSVESLVQLACGGFLPGRSGGPLHARLRYFDPERRRSGLSRDVAALVERMTADEVTVSLVNVNQVEPRQLVIQAGTYGEHRIEHVSVNQEPPRPVEGAAIRVALGPGTGGRLTIKMRRYAQPPTLKWPAFE